MTLYRYLPVWVMIDKLVLLMCVVVFSDTARYYGLYQPAVWPLTMKLVKPAYPIVDVGTFAEIRSGEICVVPAAIKCVHGGTVEFANGKQHTFDPYDDLLTATSAQPAPRRSCSIRTMPPLSCLLAYIAPSLACCFYFQRSAITSTYLPSDDFIRYLDTYTENFTVRSYLGHVVRTAWYYPIGECRFVPDLDTFHGKIVHAANYRSWRVSTLQILEGFDGYTFLVVGYRNSGMKISYDFVVASAVTSVIVHSEVTDFSRALVQFYNLWLIFLSNKKDFLVFITTSNLTCARQPNDEPLTAAYAPSALHHRELYHRW
ncbi:hypothetical protein GUJ93_ZPchr0001g31119 [Zizania palustris]|uniref:Uncharacterized protein n=1 Tax=Zizania palustris TaxID=103762 RepID=A0A8J5RMV0_ZIZPA|nr:hypothetical protein GUJ93_ZPchr0001g31119 [Zizania palustris]